MEWGTSSSSLVTVSVLGSGSRFRLMGVGRERGAGGEEGASRGSVSGRRLKFPAKGKLDRGAESVERESMTRSAVVDL